MFESDTDKQWERFGSEDPYYGVLTDAQFHRDSMTPEAKEAFFQSGQNHVQEVLATIRRTVAPGFQPTNALDYGCGVGRVVLPLSRVSSRVTGADVSPSMLDEARRNCDERGAENATLLRVDDSLSALGHTYDLVHSFIVFQHIPERRGEALFGDLLARIAPGGVGVFQFTYGKSRLTELRMKFGHLRLDLRDRVFGSSGPPRMRMSRYRLDRLLLILQKSGIQEFHGQYTDHGGELGVVLMFQRPVGA